MFFPDSLKSKNVKKEYAITHQSLIGMYRIYASVYFLPQLADKLHFPLYLYVGTSIPAVISHKMYCATLLLDLLNILII